MALTPVLDSLTLADLEHKILSTSRYSLREAWEFSKSVGGHHAQVNNANRDLLRRWLVGVGGDFTKARTASDRVLGNAFKVRDAYIERFNESDDSRRRRRDRDMPQRPKIELDLDELDIPPGFGRAPEKEDFDLDLDSKPGVGGFGRPTPAPTPAPAPYMDESQIARIADQIIGKRINDGLIQLTGQVAGVVKLAAKKEVDTQKEELWAGLNGLAADLRSSIRSEIVALATETAVKFGTEIAKKMIEENLPRRLEVKINGHAPKILDASPRHRIFDECLKWLAGGEHVYLVGGAGTGKTFLFKQLAEALGYDLDTQFFPIDQSLTKYDVKGYNSPTGEYIETLVYKAVTEGGFMCIDEGDMWAAAALGSLNSILANQYGTFTNKVVQVHPNFRCIFAANTFGRGADGLYVGRNPQDGAALDRFAYVVCDYDEAMENQIHGTGPWVEYVQRVRAAVAELKLPHIISMRATKRCLTGVEIGLDPDQIAFSALWRGLDPDTVKRIKSRAGEPPRPSTPVLNGGEIIELPKDVQQVLDTLEEFRRSIPSRRNELRSELAEDIYNIFEGNFAFFRVEEFLEALEDGFIGQQNLNSIRAWLQEHKDV